ncbi:hypothetical protein IQ266_04795 [filamentous cyanobacterium LEGE 11480]|uniref:Major royal jelly protein n=1 Tax=Romeriopsis navalis LEGE 11480 TaxID=2777977 RepID=A0A928VJV5_9CYAN|nr:major royal jelly family protein [Romeriopsis navalis]MBE9029078.1 hypothetical protein [Romeriopsis navalis LEGE 11480]
MRGSKYWQKLWLWLTIAMITAGIVSSSLQPSNAASKQPNQIEIVAELPKGSEVGNIAITRDGRIFCSIHRFFGSASRAIEVLPGNRTRLYPNRDWGKAPTAAGEDWAGLNNTLGIQADGNGILWFLDNPDRNFPTGRLIGWDTQRETLHRVIYLPPPLITENAFLNDLAIDAKHNAIYIADTAGGQDAALIVVDLATGLSRRVLQRDQSVIPEDIDMVIDGRNIKLGPDPARVGVNPITIDPSYEWVYYGPMSGSSLYRIRTKDLRNTSIMNDNLAKRVERYGDRPISDGITIDGDGNVYITDITHNAIGVTDKTGKYRILYQNDKLLSWPDGFAVGPDGYIYAAVNQLHKAPPLNDGKDDSTAPYHVIRFPAVAPSTIGR